MRRLSQATQNKMKIALFSEKSDGLLLSLYAQQFLQLMTEKHTIKLCFLSLFIIPIINIMLNKIVEGLKLIRFKFPHKFPLPFSLGYVRNLYICEN